MEQDELLEEEEEQYQENKYLLFRLAGEVYGIMIGYVTDIIELKPVTYIPDMPAYVKGVINLRNKIIPVIDLRIRFGMPEREYDDRTCIIVITMGELSVGFIVDTVTEVKEILDTDISDPPKFNESGIDASYIAGLGKVHDEVKILIDVEHVLSQYDIQLLQTNANAKEGAVS
ncbi:MAG: purine-binding chemotaxis protein CheW [Spirochaetales bacterium]|nr:purine-binding chemotaxis protein CheW [Spirochaetales bacterium]